MQNSLLDNVLNEEIDKASIANSIFKYRNDKVTNEDLEHYSNIRSLSNDPIILHLQEQSKYKLSNKCLFVVEGQLVALPKDCLDQIREDMNIQEIKQVLKESLLNELSKKTLNSYVTKGSERSLKEQKDSAKPTQPITRLTKEEFDYLNEISKGTLLSYINKANADFEKKSDKAVKLSDQAKHSTTGPTKAKNLMKKSNELFKKADVRLNNIGKATGRLIK